MGKKEIVVLEGKDAFLDAFCMQYGLSIVAIDEKLAEIPESNPNKKELVRYRRLLAAANNNSNLESLDAWLTALLIGIKAATHTIPLAIMGKAFKDNQEKKARLKRSRIKFDGEAFSISSIIDKLAKRTDALGDFLTSSDLWPELFNMLDERGMEPRESGKEKNEQITFLKDDECSFGTIRKSSFKAMLSKARKTQG